ncbi:hypothetical protein WG947_09315 [Pontibacter sp. H259]|uniref:hypothetical protein n=1 Tax=Pontibacter sp. H259 TaxID=3133421 RepID=UPI0030C1FA55
MKTPLLILLLVLVAATCSAQTNCAPTLKFSSGTQELAAALPHDDLPPTISIKVLPNPNCQNGISYEIFRGMAYIVKNNQLVDEVPLNGSSAQITRWQYQLQAGDRISFKVTHMYAVNAKGEKKPITKSLTGSIEIK